MNTTTHTYQHTYTPTHNPRPDAVIEAEEEAAWCWKRLDEHLEERDPNLDHYQTEWWEQHWKLYQATIEAEEWLTNLRYQALNCTCDPDPNRQSMLCPACRALQPAELPY